MAQAKTQTIEYLTKEMNSKRKFLNKVFDDLDGMAKSGDLQAISQSTMILAQGFKSFHEMVNNMHAVDNFNIDEEAQADEFSS